MRLPVLLAFSSVAVLSALAPPAAARERPPGADCRTTVHGSTATAVCFNPDAAADRVQLHIECATWWDPDVDGRPVTLGPARGARLTDRCWFGIRAAWVSHRLR